MGRRKRNSGDLRKKSNMVGERDATGRRKEVEGEGKKSSRAKGREAEGEEEEKEER